MHRRTYELMCDATFPSPTSPSTSFPLPSFSPVLSDLSRADNRLLDTLVPYNSTVKYDLTSLSTNTEFYSSYSHRNLTDTHCPDPRVSDTSDLFKDVCYLNNPLRYCMSLNLPSFRRRRRPSRTRRPPRSLFRSLHIISIPDCRA